MKYTANQNLLWPHIYMMNRYYHVDHYVSMNNAQFTKFGHQSRVELLDKHGKVVLLTIPLKDRSFKPLNAVEVVSPEKVAKTMLSTAQMLYGQQPHYRKLREWFTHVIESAPMNSGTVLSEFNNHLLRNSFDLLGLKVQWHDSEVLIPNRPEHPSEWVAQLGHAINCTHYLGGGVAQSAYLRKEDFASRGMVFEAQDFKMKPYSRGGSLQDRATVSFLDPLFYGGPELVIELIAAPAL